MKNSADMSRGWVNDSPEKIDKCLNCERTFCNNCLGASDGIKRINREEFMQLYNAGYNDQQIAKMLCSKVKTVTSYRQSLRLKVNKG